MKFVTNSKDEVRVTMVVDGDGDIEIRANNVELLWIMDNGMIQMCTYNSDALRAMGFDITDDGTVTVIE